MAEYSADSPLLGPDDDRFQRWPFARRVAEVIATRRDPASIVIGINGAWGEGKTTVLNFIAEELKRHGNVVCFRFNPWRFPDEARLIRDFFQSLAQAVDKKLETGREKLGGVVSKYLSIPAGLAGAGDSVKAVGELMSSVDLEDLRERIEKILLESGKRVVVLMDDIDRLDKAETQAVFRLVKLVADFHNTAYVLAFDSEMVASALQERYSPKDPRAGLNFLEKIVQVPLDLPHIAQEALRLFNLQIIERAINEAEIELSESDVQSIQRGYLNGLEVRLRTPRMAKRYGNILSFALPILKGEVNPVDLILIEGIRALYPPLYDTIRDHPEVFLPSGSTRDMQWQAAQKHAKDVVEVALEGFSPPERRAATELLKQLFPRMEGVFGGPHYASSFEDSWARARRITSRAYFQRFFSYAIPEGQVSDRELSEFVEQLRAESVEEAARELGRLVGRRNAAYVVAKLRADAETVDAASAAKLAAAVIRDGSIYPNPKQMFGFTGPFSQAAMLASDLVARVSLLEGDEAAYELATEVVQGAKPLTFALEVFSWLRVDSDDGEDREEDRDRFGRPIRKALPKEHRALLSRVLAVRIEETLSNDSTLESLTAEELVRYLGAWAAYTSRDETKLFVSAKVKADPAFAIRILDGLRPTAWGLETGLSSKLPFEREQYETLERFVDPVLINDVLESHLGPYQPSEHFPRFVDREPGRLVADQFLWLHRHVLAENQNAKNQPHEPDVAPDAGEDLAGSKDEEAP